MYAMNTFFRVALCANFISCELHVKMIINVDCSRDRIDFLYVYQKVDKLIQTFFLYYQTSQWYLNFQLCK